MKTTFYLALDDGERSIIIRSLNSFRNRLIAQGKYTDGVDEIAEATENLDTVQTQIKAIKEQKISQKRIFEFLELFDTIYDEFTEFEKKEFRHSFIKKIEIYPEPLENGQILKSIQFRFPVYYQGNEVDMFIPNSENTVECVCALSRR